MESPLRTRPLTLAIALGVAASAACSGPRRPSLVPTDVRFVSREDWNAQPPVLPMTRHDPTRITIHHTGVAQAPARSVESKLAGLQAFSQRDDSLASGKKKPAWADVPYHFYVAVDGSVAEGRDWRYVGDSNTPYDPTGHLLVVVEGSFGREELTPEQHRALESLVPALAKHFDIPPERIEGHRDFAETSCPGKDLYAELPRLRDLVAAR